MAELTAGRNLKTVDVVYESDEIIGPGWLMFFTETVRISPARAGGAKDKAKSTKHRDQQLRELGLEEDDLIDIIDLTIRTGLID